jgi:DNA-binding NtrC family response regulator
MVGVGHAYTKTVEILAPKSTLTPCILDDDPAQLEALSALVEELVTRPCWSPIRKKRSRCVRCGRSRLLLADPGIHGYEFLDKALRTDPGVHVIVMTAPYTLDSALEAIRRGATDFLPKPVDRNRLKRTQDEVAALYSQRQRVRALEEQLLKDLEFHGIVGKSPAMLGVSLTSRARSRGTTPMC